MVMTMFMIVMMVMVFMAVVMIVIMLMFFMTVVMIMICVTMHREAVRMQICHIMIMILMFRIQHNIKITCIQRRLFHTADYNTCTFQMKTVQRIQKNFPVGTKIEQCRNRHISTDTTRAVQNQSFFT